MELTEELSEADSPVEFLEESVPRLHSENLQLFSSVVPEPIIVSFYFEDVDRRVSIRLDSDGCEVREGMFIDFPVATIEGRVDEWEAFKESVMPLARTLEKLERTRSPKRVPVAFLDEFEKYDGVFEIQLMAGDSALDLHPLRVILNDYEPIGGAPEVRISVDTEAVHTALQRGSGATNLTTQMNLEGDVSLAMDIGGLISTHFGD